MITFMRLQSVEYCLLWGHTFSTTAFCGNIHKILVECDTKFTFRILLPTSIVHTIIIIHYLVVNLEKYKNVSDHYIFIDILYALFHLILKSPNVKFYNTVTNIKVVTRLVILSLFNY